MTTRPKPPHNCPSNASPRNRRPDEEVEVNERQCVERVPRDLLQSRSDALIDRVVDHDDGMLGTRRSEQILQIAPHAFC